MGLGKLITRQAPAGDQENRVAGSNFQVVIDDTPIDAPMAAYRGGMSIPGAWRAANLIADLIGRLPWDGYRDYGGGPTERLDPTPPLLEQPDPENTRMTTFASWALDLVWHGNAISVIAARNSQGYPTAVYPVPAQQVGVRRITRHTYSPLPIGTIEYNIGPLSLTSNDVIHIKGPCEPGGLRGFGVLEAHMAGALSLAMEQQKQAQSVSRHGVPTGVLKVSNPDATEDDLKDAKKKWLENQTQRSVAVLNATTDFQPLSWNPEELQLVEARKYSLVELANIFGLPAKFLLAESGQSLTYSTTVQEAMDLLKFGSPAGHLARFEQTLSDAFPRGTVVKADLDALLRADTKSRYEAHQIGLQAGFLTVGEVRDLEDLPPLPVQPEILDGEVVEELERASQLQVGQGRPLWDYWTKGEGLARWASSPHPYTALVAALRSEGVPGRSVHGLAANIFHAVFGIWPGEREGDNPVGPG